MSTPDAQVKDVWPDSSFMPGKPWLLATMKWTQTHPLYTEPLLRLAGAKEFILTAAGISCPMVLDPTEATQLIFPFEEVVKSRIDVICYEIMREIYGPLLPNFSVDDHEKISDLFERFYDAAWCAFNEAFPTFFQEFTEKASTPDSDNAL